MPDKDDAQQTNSNPKWIPYATLAVSLLTFFIAMIILAVTLWLAFR